MQHLLMDMCTDGKLNRVDIQWTVKYWQLRHNKTNSMRSDLFKLHRGNNYLSFNNVKYDGDDEITKQLRVSLSYCNEHATPIINVFILDEKQEKHKLVRTTKNISKYIVNDPLYKEDFIIDKILLNESNENLVFYIEISYISEIKETSMNINRYCMIEKVQKSILNDYSRINDNEESLLQDNITFLIGDTKVKAHAFILSAISPYFSAMFRHDDFKENKERTITLTDDIDVTPENFQIFLDILYGHKNIEDIEGKLLTQICILADKYNVQEVSEACEFLLSRTITVENVIELLIFAENYNCKFLKHKAVIYAKDNIDIVKQTPIFDDLFNNKTLLLQLL